MGKKKEKLRNRESVSGKSITQGMEVYLANQMLEIGNGYHISYLKQAMQRVEDAVGSHGIVYNSEKNKAAIKQREERE